MDHGDRGGRGKLNVWKNDPKQLCSIFPPFLTLLRRRVVVSQQWGSLRVFRINKFASLRLCMSLPTLYDSRLSGIKRSKVVLGQRDFFPGPDTHSLTFTRVFSYFWGTNSCFYPSVNTSFFFLCESGENSSFNEREVVIWHCNGACVCVRACILYRKNSHQRKYRVDGFFCLTSYKVVISIYTLSQWLVNLRWIIFQSVLVGHEGHGSNGGILAWIKTLCVGPHNWWSLSFVFKRCLYERLIFYYRKKLLETNRMYTPRDASSLLFLLFFFLLINNKSLGVTFFALFWNKALQQLAGTKNWILFFFEVFEVYALTDLQGERERELLNESLNKKGWEQ